MQNLGLKTEIAESAFDLSEKNDEILRLTEENEKLQHQLEVLDKELSVRVHPTVEMLTDRRFTKHTLGYIAAIAKKLSVEPIEIDQDGYEVE